VRFALLAMVSLTVLLGLLLGVMTMHQHHAAHHAVPAPAPVGHSAHGAMVHSMAGGVGGHQAHQSIQPPRETVVAVSGDNPADTAGQIALKLCLAVLIGLGGLALRAALTGREVGLVTAAVARLASTGFDGVRPRSSGPPGRATITRLCVLRQ
jgi:hypothetical protein